ncbi:MAG: FtsX-like permease family protein [Lachnospiraceae bacterium]|nr:FtsX-like permease family protein [Lachnospiraceae bacterium]
MFHIMLQKLLHKKWMMLCMVLGNVLLIAIACAYPMFRDASLTRMLKDEFVSYEKRTNKDSSVISITGKLRKKGNTKGYEWSKDKAENLLNDMQLDGGLLLKYNYLQTTSATPTVMRESSLKDGRYTLCSMDGLQDNIELISGDMFSGEIIDGDTIEVMVTINCFVRMELLVGEELEFKYIKLPNGNPLKVKVCGVFAPLEEAADYWQKDVNLLSSDFFVMDTLYNEIFLDNPLDYDQNTTWYIGFDYTTLTYDKVDKLLGDTYMLLDESSEYGEVERPAYLKFLENYLVNEKKIQATLIILQVPVLVLLLAFIYMISGQMYSMEQNEISVMMSRGASKGQILSLYLMQSVLVSAIGCVIGLPLGALLCRALGSASAFLEFSGRRALSVTITPGVLIYMAGAAVLSVLMGVLPSVIGSRGSIVKTLASRARNKTPLWQKLFLDVIFLGVSIYGYYNFSRHKDALEASVLAGESLDPLLYLSSSLFILGAAMLMLRLIPLLVRLINRIGERTWPAFVYASFCEIIRSVKKQYFIMIFLILTASLGIFNTTVARTIASNNERNLEYKAGADIVLKETWANNKYIVAMDSDIPLVYTEPDFGKYEMLSCVDKAARVYEDDMATFKGDYIKVMGINTKEFGEATALPANLLEKHYYDYLNAMSYETNLILASSSFRDVLEYGVGDSITYKLSGEEVTGVIADFVEYFPGFENQITAYNADGTVYKKTQYLIVAHLSELQGAIGVKPYKVWIKLKDGANADELYDYIRDNGIKVSEFEDLSLEIEDMKSDTLFQGTNGILTLSFMVILVLCFIGYLIYWTLTISSRELLLGVLRAMGMSKNEVFGMLIIEQFFSAIIPLACGAGIGILSSKLFVPLIQIAYCGGNMILPLKLVTLPGDMIRMFVIIIVMILACFIVLARQVSGLKISQALKLGED